MLQDARGRYKEEDRKQREIYSGKKLSWICEFDTLLKIHSKLWEKSRSRKPKGQNTDPKVNKPAVNDLYP